jgi:hypothetical protein
MFGINSNIIKIQWFPTTVAQNYRLSPNLSQTVKPELKITAKLRPLIYINHHFRVQI